MRAEPRSQARRALAACGDSHQRGHANHQRDPGATVGPPHLGLTIHHRDMPSVRQTVNAQCARGLSVAAYTARRHMGRVLARLAVFTQAAAETRLRET
jgi:hypothetical protein